MRRLSGPAAVAPPGPLAKLALAAGGLVAIAVGLVVSVAAFAVALVAAGIGFCWLAWKTRALRRAVRDGMAAREATVVERPGTPGRVYEGQAVSIPDERR